MPGMSDTVYRPQSVRQKRDIGLPAPGGSAAQSKQAETSRFARAQSGASIKKSVIGVDSLGATYVGHRLREKKKPTQGADR